MRGTRAVWWLAALTGAAVLLYGLLVVRTLDRGWHHAEPNGLWTTLELRSAQIVGKSLTPVEVTLSDGRRLRIPDRLRFTAICLGGEPRLLGAVAGMRQLAPLLPAVTFLVAPHGASRAPSRALAASLGTDGAVGYVSRQNTALDQHLGALLGARARPDGEWWLIDQVGQVKAFGAPELGGMMEAGLAWPFLLSDDQPSSRWSGSEPARLDLRGARRDWKDRLLELWRQRVVAGYRTYGHHGAWDPLVADFLEQRCRQLARHDSAANTMDLAVQAQAVLASGCDDPLVVHLAAGALRRDRDDTPAAAAYVRARSLLDRARYPARTIYMVSLPAPGESAQASEEEARQRDELLAEALTGPYAPGEQRLDVDRLLSPGTAVVTPRLLELLAANGADLWLRACLEARCQQELARADGASGEMSVDVSKAAQEAQQRMRDSVQPLVLANRLHPDLPEAAESALRSLTNTRDLSGGALWLQTALSADVDSPAAEAYREAIHPVNQFQPDKRIDLAHELSDPSLVGTEAPLMACLLLTQRGDETTGQRLFRHRTALDDALDLIHAMITAAATPQQAARLRTVELAMLLGAGREDQAGKLADRLGDQVDYDLLERWNSEWVADTQRWWVARELGTADVAMALAQEQPDVAAAAFAKLAARARTRATARWLEERMAQRRG